MPHSSDRDLNFASNLTMFLCPRCQRANPDGAVFCFLDGVELRTAAGPSDGDLPREFVFPSGRRCRTFDQLAQACQQEWAVARDLLQEGTLAQFLATAGRADLVRATQTALAQPDKDLALHHFLASLPGARLDGPRLDLQPRRLLLDGFRPGEKRDVELTVNNQGTGLLYGTLAVTLGGQWLRLPGADESGALVLKAPAQQRIVLHVNTEGLPAAQAYPATLTVVTNGGVVQVPVSLDLPALPFPHAPFEGAGAPRPLAERMRANPKAAVALLHDGAVAAWFAANGWNYPILDAPAPGVAAVQQFFEALGLTRPPAVALSETALSFTCVYPEEVHGQVVLVTPRRKWVYAAVDTDVPWLRILTPRVSGLQQAVVEFEVDSSMLEPGGVHDGRLQLRTNGGQQLVLSVSAEVYPPQRPFTRRLFGRS